jgi:hypothetical protein
VEADVTNKMAKGLRQLLETLLIKEKFTRKERLEILDHRIYPSIRDNLFDLLCLIMRKARKQGTPLVEHILMEIKIAAGYLESMSDASPVLESDSSTSYFSFNSSGSSPTSSVVYKLPLGRFRTSSEENGNHQTNSYNEHGTYDGVQPGENLDNESDSDSDTIILNFDSNGAIEDSQCSEDPENPSNGGMTLRSRKKVGGAQPQGHLSCDTDSDQLDNMPLSLRLRRVRKNKKTTNDPKEDSIFTTENEELDNSGNIFPNICENRSQKQTAPRSLLEKCLTRVHLFRDCRAQTQALRSQTLGPQSDNVQPSTSAASQSDSRV